MGDEDLTDDERAAIAEAEAEIDRLRAVIRRIRGRGRARRFRAKPEASE